MTINELHIQLDLQFENRIDILEDVARKCNEGYLFVDSIDGYCYLFDEDGNENDIKKLTTIDNKLFYDSNIESIVIPNSVESIGNYVFAFCGNLTSIEIPDSVKHIGNCAFKWCESLTSIVIPNSVKWIGDYAFVYCGSLTSITIPDSIKKIENWAFGYCDKLKSIIIPNSIEWIGNRVFWCCVSLKSLVFKGKTMEQVKEMDNYPFGIKDESIIKCI